MSEEQGGQELARDLGFLEAYTMGVGTMIGAGIFVLPSIAAESAGPASMVSFLIGGFVSLLTALSLSELATGMPRAGGSYYYVNRALGSFFGSIVGWGMWAGLMFATAFYMLGFGQYLTFFWGRIPVSGAALAMAALLVLVNYRGVKEAGSLQNFIVTLLLGCILVFVAFGIFEIDWQVFRPFNPRGWGAVAATAATLYVTFIGFEVIATSAEEIKNPGRNLPLAMIASVLTPLGLYVLVMLVCTGVLPVPELAASRIPVADVARQYLGPMGALMMVVGAVFATVSSANASILSAARVNFAMGRDRILSGWLNEVHRDYRTPYRAILVTGALVLSLIAFGVGLETLADVASLAFLLTYALVHVGVMVMRRAAPADYRPSFRLPGAAYPLVPFLGLVSCIVIIAQMRTAVLLIGSGIVAMGIVWHWGYASRRVEAVSLVGEAIVGAAREREVAAAESVYRIVVPVANPDTERYLLELATSLAGERADRRETELVAVNVVEVPPQTALEQGLEFEARRVRVQQRLLESAQEFARERGVGLRTRALVGRNVGRSILFLLEEERADHVVLGWKGQTPRRQHILGQNLDAVARETSCEVTLVKIGAQSIGRVVALVGQGPNTLLALRRAARIVGHNEGAELTLLNVQAPDGEVADPSGRGVDLIVGKVAEAGLSELSYEPRVLVDDDIEGAILGAVGDYDMVCVGATRSTALAQAIFGSIPESIGQHAAGTVVIVRGARYKPRTVTEALIERLGGRRAPVR